MFGCLRRLGCLIVLLALAGAGYYWYTHVYTRRAEAAAAAVWRPVRSADAEQARRAIESLRTTQGKVFVNLTATQAVGYLVHSIATQLPPSAQGVEAMITGDTLHVRTVLSLKELGAEKALGPLGGLLGSGSKDTVQLSGTVDVVRPGLAQLRVTDVRIRALDIPSALIPRLMGQLRRNTPEGIAANGLPMPLPSYIGDIRIANGKVTLYKNV